MTAAMVVNYDWNHALVVESEIHNGVDQNNNENVKGEFQLSKRQR